MWNQELTGSGPLGHPCPSPYPLAPERFALSARVPSPVYFPSPPREGKFSDQAPSAWR